MAKKRTYKTPESSKRYICMTPMEPSKFQQACITMAINTLRKMGVPINDMTNDYDPQYPRLMWDNGEITQSKADGDLIADRIPVDTLENFIALFEIPEKVTVKNISKDYDAVVYNDRVVVGCQVIKAEKFKEIVSGAKAMGMI